MRLKRRLLEGLFAVEAAEPLAREAAAEAESGRDAETAAEKGPERTEAAGEASESAPPARRMDPAGNRLQQTGRLRSPLRRPDSSVSRSLLLGKCRTVSPIVDYWTRLPLGQGMLMGSSVDLFIDGSGRNVRGEGDAL